MLSFLYFLLFTSYHIFFLCLKYLKNIKVFLYRKKENNIFIKKKSFQIFRHFRHLGMLFDICFLTFAFSIIFIIHCFKTFQSTSHYKSFPFLLTKLTIVNKASLLKLLFYCAPFWNILSLLPLFHPLHNIFF